MLRNRRNIPYFPFPAAGKPGHQNGGRVNLPRTLQQGQPAAGKEAPSRRHPADVRREDCLVPGGVRAQRGRSGIRHRKRSRRFGGRERAGRRCGAGRVGPVRIGPHGIGTRFRREWLGFVHWRNCHGCPSAARLFPVCGREFRIRPRPAAGTGSGRDAFRGPGTLPEPAAWLLLSPGSERPPHLSGRIYILRE